MPAKENETFNCICGNIYKYRPGLAKHKRTCFIYKSFKEECENNCSKYDNIIEYNIDNEDDIDSEILGYTEKNKKACQHKHAKNIKDKLVLKLIKDNSEMMKIIKGQQEQINIIIPKLSNITNNTTNNTTNHTTNNTTNNFNLNVFLNEKCKDALNISDFIDSLKITLDDLLFSKKNGISRGITDVMIKGLRSICEPIENYDNYERKIIKNIEKEILVDKNNY